MAAPREPIRLEISSGVVIEGSHDKFRRINRRILIVSAVLFVIVLVANSIP
jgi:hypothetical protein